MWERNNDTVSRRWDRPNAVRSGNNGGRGRYEGNNRNQGYNNRGGSNFRSRNGGGDRPTQDFRRNQTQSRNEDPLFVGLKEHKVKTIEEIQEMEWQSLENEQLEEEYGFSKVPTLALEENRILSKVLVKALHDRRNYTRLTPVQAQTILPILGGSSMVVRAKTGTGKTGAFAVPMIQKVLEAKRNGVQGVKAVIIAPARELAQQITDEITKITMHGELKKIRTTCFVGGYSLQQQIRHGLSGPRNISDIVVATPGRLLDILGGDSGPEVTGLFENVTMVTLDEADRLLDFGFKDDLAQIREYIEDYNADAEKIQTLMFSATVDQSIRSLARKMLGSSLKIVDTVDENEPEAQELVSQHVISCDNFAEVYYATMGKIVEEASLHKNTDEPFKAMVFAPLTDMVNNFKDALYQYNRMHRAGLPMVIAVHGKMTQNARQRHTDMFRKSNSAILITTDVSGRGIDIPHVTHVFQLGSTGDVAPYVHRIGRTARIGNSGKSYLAITRQEAPFVNSLKRQNVSLTSNQKYIRDEEFIEKVQDVFAKKLEGLPESMELYNKLFSSYASIFSNMRVDREQFVQDQVEFGELLGANLADRRSVSNFMSSSKARKVQKGNQKYGRKTGNDNWKNRNHGGYGKRKVRF